MQRLNRAAQLTSARLGVLGKKGMIKSDTQDIYENVRMMSAGRSESQEGRKQLVPDGSLCQELRSGSLGVLSRLHTFTQALWGQFYYDTHSINSKTWFQVLHYLARWA